MQEIKYRQSVYEGITFCYWHYWGFFDGIFTYPDMTTFRDIGRDSYGFTGFRDKNGVEIYEGDIVKSVYDSGELDQIAIVYCKSPCSWVWGVYNNLDTALVFNKDTEVIGNICETKDIILSKPRF